MGSKIPETTIRIGDTMIAVLRKSDRELLGVADTIREARKIRLDNGGLADTITEIVGVAGYKPRIIR